jgi:hypothetical protein
MNKKQYNKEQEVLRLLDSCRNKDINLIKGSGIPAESDSHFLAKCKKCKELLNNGHRFVTEARFKYNKGRADILDITEGIIFEVVNSETEESLIKKKAKYPLPFEIIKVV